MPTTEGTPTSDAHLKPAVLRRSIFSAARWSLLLRIVTRCVALVATIVVARLVPQSELGKYAIIIIPDAALAALTSVGFASAIIQMKGDPKSYLDTAWTFEAVRGVALFIAKLLFAPLWCSFFQVPDATPAMQLLAVANLVQGFHSISSTTLVREMRFDRIFYIYASETVAYVAAAVPLAYWLRDRWALVLAIIISFVVRVIVSYLVSPVRARFAFDRTKALEMFRYGRWLTGFSVADFLLETTDNAIVGRVLGPIHLARYRMAFQLATEGPLTMHWVVARVAFPTFSRLQDDPGRVRANFRALLGLIMATMVPITVGLVMLGGVFLPLLLGGSWAPAVEPLRILVVAGLFRSILGAGPPLLAALGRTRLDFILKAIQLLVMCALLLPAARYYGISGVSWSVVIASAATLPFFVVGLHRAADLSAGDFLMPIVSPLVAGAAGLGVLIVLPPAAHTWPSLLIHGVVLVTVYGAASWLLHRMLPGSGFGAVARGAGA